MKKEKLSKLEQRKIDERRKNLGHWKDPEEIKEPAQFQVSKTTATKKSEAVFTAVVNQQEAAVLYQGVFRPKVEYPLAQWFLPDKHVKKTESVSLLKILVKFRYTRAMASPIKGGP